VRVFLVLPFLALSLLVGCVGERREPVDLKKIQKAVELEKIWKKSLGDSEGEIFTPASNGVVVCGASKKSVTCFSLDAGDEVFETKLQSSLAGGVGISDDYVFVGAIDGSVTALRMSGDIHWIADVGNVVTSPPVLSGSTVVIRDIAQRVVGLDAENGQELWDFRPPGQSLSLKSDSRLSVDQEGAVYAGFPGGIALRLNGVSGEVAWSVSVTTPSGDNEIERISDVLGAPLLIEDMACFGTYQGRIGCYSSELGEQRWSVPASVAGGVVSDGIQLFSTESNGHVRAIDLKTGRAGWRNEDLLYRRLSSPITLSSYVIVGDVEGVISVFNSNTGEIIGRQKTDGTPIVASPIVVADKIIVQTSGGSLFAFELSQDI